MFFAGGVRAAEALLRAPQALVAGAGPPGAGAAAAREAVDPRSDDPGLAAQRDFLIGVGIAGGVQTALNVKANVMRN